MTSPSKSFSEREDAAANLFLCHSPLQVLHSHLVRREHLQDRADWFLAYAEWISPLMVRPKLWTKVISVSDSRPEYGQVIRKIRTILATLEREISFSKYRSINLVVSDLYWLMNNCLVAGLARFCRRENIAFRISILDEGSVLYTNERVGLRRLLRCWAKYLYLAAHWLPGLLLHPGNVDYYHPLCRRVYCLHPELLKPPDGVPVDRIEATATWELYGDASGGFRFPPKSCLYLSQPMYKLAGMELQREIVCAMQRQLQAEGIQHFFYKPHHADRPSWTERLERECGMEPLIMQELPIELLASRCDASVIVSHSCSALLNVAAYGFRGRVIAYGLNRLRGAFRETAQFEDFVSVLRRVGGVELVDAPERDDKSCATAATASPGTASVTFRE